MTGYALNQKKRISEGRGVIPNGILGMFFLIATEMMFFSGLISGYIVNGAERPGAWKAPWVVALPFVQTAANTALLLASAVTMFVSYFFMTRGNAKKSRLFLILTTILGIAFVLLQGREWIGLIDFGLTIGSGLFGAFFYTIIGAHGLHVSAGVIVLLYLLSLLLQKEIDSKSLAYRILVASLYWYFVVFLWPLLYWLVYFH